MGCRGRAKGGCPVSEPILEEALELFKESEAGSADIRQRALEDIKFGRMGEQWPEAVAETRRQEGRPCLTINRLPSFIRRVVNDARQNKPSISVHPVGNDGDYDTAQVIGGLIRSIERGSNAALAYDTAIDHACSAGFGFFRITTDYCHPDSFDQEARIERVANPFSVHWDVNSTAFDASDWSYGFVSEMLTEDAFKARYKKAKPVSWQDGVGQDWDDWATDEGVRVSEFWQRSEHTRKIALLSDGRVVPVEDLDKAIEVAPGVKLPLKEILGYEGVTVVRERDSQSFKVKRRVISGVEVLDEEDWPGTLIPICPVWGEEVMYRGKREFRSLIRDARDPQMMMNFWRSASTELVALAPRAPWLVPMGGIPPEEQIKWQSANTRSHAYLTYDASAGPMPQRQAFAGVPAGALQEALNAQDDMKSVMGIFDAALGARGNETSGRAILARQRESDTSTFHFIDNMARAIQYAGRVLIDIIPALYNERQTVRILGEDEAPRVARLVASNGEPPSEEDPDGKIYDLSVGTYDVTVRVGPNYQTQRQEAADALTELSRAYPPAAAIIGDLIVKNMDWPGADEAAERIQFMQYAEGMKIGLPKMALDKLFPKIAEMFAPQQPPPGQPGQPPQPDPAQMAQQQAQMAAQQAQAAAQAEAQAKAQAEQAKLQAQQQADAMKIQAQAQIEQMKAEVAVQIEQMKQAAETERAQMRIQAEAQRHYETLGAQQREAPAPVQPAASQEPMVINLAVDARPTPSQARGQRTVSVRRDAEGNLVGVIAEPDGGA